MHPRIDLGLVLCAFGLHDEIRVAESSIYPARMVLLRRCLRCSRHLPQRRRPTEGRIDPERLPRSRSHYS